MKNWHFFVILSITIVSKGWSLKKNVQEDLEIHQLLCFAESFDWVLQVETEDWCQAEPVILNGKNQNCAFSVSFQTKWTSLFQKLEITVALVLTLSVSTFYLVILHSLQELFRIKSLLQRYFPLL